MQNSVAWGPQLLTSLKLLGALVSKVWTVCVSKHLFLPFNQRLHACLLGTPVSAEDWKLPHWVASLQPKLEHSISRGLLPGKHTASISPPYTLAWQPRALTASQTPDSGWKAWSAPPGPQPGEAGNSSLTTAAAGDESLQHPPHSPSKSCPGPDRRRFPGQEKTIGNLEECPHPGMGGQAYRGCRDGARAVLESEALTERGLGRAGHRRAGHGRTDTGKQHMGEQDTDGQDTGGQDTGGQDTHGQDTRGQDMGEPTSRGSDGLGWTEQT